MFFRPLGYPSNCYLFSVLKRVNSQQTKMTHSGPHIEFLLKINNDIAKGLRLPNNFQDNLNSLYKWLSIHGNQDKAQRQLAKNKFFKKQYEMSLLKKLWQALPQLNSLTPENRKYLNGIMTVNIQHLFRHLNQQKNTQVFMQALKEFLIKVRFLLVFLDDSNVVTIIKLIKLYDFVVLRNVNQSFFYNELNAFNVLLTKVANNPYIKQLNLRNLTLILYFFSKISKKLSSLVHDDYCKFSKKIVQLHPDWYTHLLQGKSLMLSVATQGIYCQQFKEDCLKALNYVKNIKKRDQVFYDYIMSLVRAVMALRILDAQTLVKEYPHIVKIIDEKPQYFWKQYPQFTKFNLWIRGLWLYALKQIHEMPKIPDLIYLQACPAIHSIYMFKDEMEPQTFKELDEFIRSSANLTKLKDATDEQIFNSNKRHYYDSLVQQMNFQQLNLSEVLKSKNIPFEFQKQMKGVRVDLFIGNDTIVEIHGPTHYVSNMDTGERKENISSHWRRRYLEKFNKYKIVEIDISKDMSSAPRLIKQILY